MIEVEITEDIVEEAKKYNQYVRGASESTWGNKVSVSETGWLVGRIGTLVVANYYDVPLTSIDKTDFVVGGPDTFYSPSYDMLVDGYKIVVKTKTRNVPPLPHYEASVPGQSIDMIDADYYIFVSLYKQEKAYIMGTMKTDEFLEKSTAYKKGDIDLSNNFKVRINCHNIAYEKLHDLGVLV